MAFTLYDAASPIFVRGLNALSGLIDKAGEAGMDEAALMQARLAPDMRPFPDQIRMAAFGARASIARLTDRQWPKTDDSESNLEELKATIALSVAFIESVDRAAFAGAETRRVELRFPGAELNFEGAGYLTSFAIPNFYFHVTTAYDILRHLGLEIGKKDFLGRIELI